MRIFYDRVSACDSGVTDAYEGMHQVTALAPCPKCHTPITKRPHWRRVRSARFAPWWFETQTVNEAIATIRKWAKRWTTGSILVQWQIVELHRPLYRIAIFHCKQTRIQPVNALRPAGFPT